jgi:hypothetical protein
VHPVHSHFHTILITPSKEETRITPEENERMNVLCRQIQIEKDQRKFSALIEELNKLLARKENRLDKPTSANP